MARKEIKTIIKEALSSIEYETVILFGSRARGDFTEESDYDILIVLKENLVIKEKIKLMTQIRKEFAKEGIDADILIKSKNEINYYNGKIGSVVKSALEEGITL